MQIRAVKLIGIAIVVFLVIGLVIHLGRPNYGRCAFYDQPETLDGGVKSIQGTDYRFQMCGTGGNDQDGTDDRIELRVFDSRGVLLARRYFSVNWYAGRSSHQPLKYEDNRVGYIDVSDEANFHKSLTIPPTKWDWIMARLPLF
ncbi:hypothetical protein [Burkholderia seminalis]|uniref:hypothetical protein n=1 Tax=Burkholderia seminalis TaxID=488731 RepID=UPI001F3C24C9|nr:hypothetical protein [Burkholderia seminalis]